MQRNIAKLAATGMAVALVSLLGCATNSVTKRASAKLQSTANYGTQGEVTFEQVGGRLIINARISGLRPNAEHGLAVHEKGDCTLNAMNAGGHFNPLAAPHGPQSAAHHVGDLPNLRADAAGIANARFEVELPRIDGGATDINGLALVVHDQRDDFTTQPTGNTGARRACGVITSASS